MMSLGPKRSRRSSASAEVRPRSPGKRPASRSTGSGRSIMEAAASFHFGLSDGARPVSVRLRGASRQLQGYVPEAPGNRKRPLYGCVCARGARAPALYPLTVRQTLPTLGEQASVPFGLMIRISPKSIGMRAHPPHPPYSPSPHPLQPTRPRASRAQRPARTPNDERIRNEERLPKGKGGLRGEPRPAQAHCERPNLRTCP